MELVLESFTNVDNTMIVNMDSGSDFAWLFIILFSAEQEVQEGL